MLFRILDKPRFQELIGTMLGSMQVVGPTQVGTNVAQKPIHQYLPIKSFADLDLGYETTDYSAKTYFLPFQEKLCTYSFGDDKWEQNIKYRLQQRALVGLHACDINALLRLDKVLGHGTFPSPYYVSRRRNTLVIGIDHPPCQGGFCRDLGTDTVTHGFDLFLTDLGDRYFVAIGSDRGYTTLKQVAVRDVEERDNDDYLEAKQKIARGFKSIVNAHNLPNILDIEFESDVWRKWGDKCLSCGSCAMTCPTCYCYGIVEDVSMDMSHGPKRKQLYSCNIVDFAEVAGGHNFRPNRGTRLKYRYYHQHRGFVEAHEEPMCVGCGRCGRACLAGINPPDLIADLQAEKMA